MTTEDTRDEVLPPAWMEDGSAYEPEHLGWNPASERHETGGDEIEYADESDESAVSAANYAAGQSMG